MASFMLLGNSPSWIDLSLILKEHIAGISAKTTAHTAFKLSQYLCYTPGYCTSYFESPLWLGNAAIKH